MPDPPIVNVGYRSTNYWVIGRGGSRLLVDLGWPGTFGTLRANLRRADVPLEALRYALATHFHIDHAGLGQELKNAGVPLLVTPDQLPAIPLMKAHTKPRDEYLEIRTDDNLVAPARPAVRCSRPSGWRVRSCTRQVTPTTASRCSSTVEAFTGDLTPPALATDEQAGAVNGPVRPLE